MNCNCDLPLRWQIFGGALLIVVFMHLTRLATEALLGERVPQDVESISAELAHAAPQLLLPSMHLLLEPVYAYIDADADVHQAPPPTPPEPVAIRVNMTLSAAPGRFEPGRPLLTLPLQIGPVPSARYDQETNPVAAHDRRGDPVPLWYRDEDPVAGPRTWFIREDAHARLNDNSSTTDLYVSFTAPHRKTDKSTRAGPRVDLRQDVSRRGLVGQGMGFLPVPPPLKEDQTDEDWNVTLEWHLAHSPPDTHGAWSFGDANKVAHTIGPLDKLATNAIFAVGALQRFPAWDEDEEQKQDLALSPGGRRRRIPPPTTMYWFDPSPPAYNMTALAARIVAAHARIAAFFSDPDPDPDHAPDPLRVFVRRIETTWGGTSASQSILLEYADDTPAYVDALSLAALVAHELVHEFASLDPAASPTDPAWQEDEGMWYVEGIASYVGILVGLKEDTNNSSGGDDDDEEDWLRALNRNMQAYYTAPRAALHMDYGAVLAHYGTSSVDVTRVPYYRGFVLAAQLDGLIARATQGARSLDDVVRALARRRRRRRGVGLAELKAVLAGLLLPGTTAWDEAYAAFFRGDVLVPGRDCLARYGLVRARARWHRFELGFEPEALREWRVRGLVAGSRADRAGVREGDVIVEAFMLWSVEDRLDDEGGNVMRMTVRRDGQDVVLEWWPRSDEIVQGYGFVKRDGAEEDADEL